MVHHIWQLQAFGPTCWIWWIVKRPLGCMCWPSLPYAFCLCFSLSNLLCVPIDYQNFLSTFGYITSSPQRVFAALTVGGSPTLSKQVWSLTKVRGWSSLCSSTAEVNGERSAFLAHDSFSTLSHLFNSPLLWCYLTGEGVCVGVSVCFFMHSAVEGWEGVWKRGVSGEEEVREGGGQTTGYG